MFETNLTNHFLIAMPNLKDPNFKRSVTYICAHNEEGAMGIVINKPLDIGLGDIFSHMEIESGNQTTNDKPVYQGGPIQIDRGFILHESTSNWDSSITISDSVSVTTSRDILEAIAAGTGPKQALIALGYAGWSGGQLEQEIMGNVWLNAPADSGIIFDTPYNNCWQKAADLMGIDVEKLSTDIGHA